MKTKDIVIFFSKAENWDDINIYIHRSRLIIGFVLGSIPAICLVIVLIIYYIKQ